MHFFYLVKPAQIVEEIIFLPHWITWAPLLRISMNLFLYTILHMYPTLHCLEVLKPGSLGPSAFFSFFKTILRFHVDFRIKFLPTPPLQRKTAGIFFNWNCVESMNWFGKIGYLINIEFSKIWTWYISPLMAACLNYSQQCFIISV